MQKPRKIPQRQCVGCREMKEKKALLRIVRTPEGQILLDGTGKKSGRGAYVCPDPACLKKARKNRSLERAFDTAIPPEVYDALEAYGDHWFTAGSVSRVRIDDVNGQPFDAEATYAVVTSNANFNGMDSSYVLKAAAEANEQSAVTTAVVRDVVFRFIAAELNHQVGEAYAAPQGRLTIL